MTERNTDVTDVPADESYPQLTPPLQFLVSSTTSSKVEHTALGKRNESPANCTRSMSENAGLKSGHRPVVVTQNEVEPQEAIADRSDAEQPHRRHKDNAQTTRAHWRPFVIRTPYIIFIITLSIALASGQEVLCQHTQKKGPLLTFTKLNDLTVTETFCWRYVPAIIVVIYGIFIATLDRQLIRLAPYYKLAREQGLRGNESLLREPTNYFYYILHPRRAGSLIWVSSLSSLMTMVLIPPVQAASLVSTASGGRYYSDATPYDSPYFDERWKYYTVSAHPVWSRILSAAFIVVAACMIVLSIILRQSFNLVETPCAIAGTITALKQTDMQNPFFDIHANSSESELNNKLFSKRFVLRNGSIKEYISSTDGRDTKRTTPNSRSFLPQRCIPPRHQPISLVIMGIITASLCCIIPIASPQGLINTIPLFLVAFTVSFKLLWAKFDVFMRSTDPSTIFHEAAPPLRPCSPTTLVSLSSHYRFKP